MHSRDGLARAARAVAVALALQACATAVDAPIPAGYRGLVESARTNVLGNFEGWIRPSLAFTQIRCFANGGVVILFKQVGGPRPGDLAFAMAGKDAVPDIWAGGFGDLASIGEEIEFNFGDVGEVACPARAG